MKLNPACIRDILLTVEDVCDFKKSWRYDYQSNDAPRLAKYKHSEIIYHIRQAELAKLLVGVHYYECGRNATISDLSPDGHEFLSNIRSDTFFAKVQEVSKEIGVASLKSLMQIAAASVSVIIKNHFNL